MLNHFKVIDFVSRVIYVSNGYDKIKLQIEELNIIDDSHLLVKLKYYLNYELSSFLLFLLSFFAGFTLWLALGAAIIFIPFMIYALIKNNKSGWIIAFLILIILPLLLLFTFVEDTVMLYTGFLIGLGVFYLFCFFLKLSVNEWVSENSWKKIRLEKDKTRKELFQDRFFNSH